MTLLHDPLFGVALTVIVYTCSLWLHHRWRRIHPLLFTSAVLIAFLLMFRIPYASYKQGGDVIAFFLGPATVALGVPLYKQFGRIRHQLRAILSGVTIGSVSGMLSAAFFVAVLGGPRQILLSMIPKSVTTPISIEIVRQLGGIPELGAVMTVLTGLLGSFIGPEFLRLIGIRDDLAIGVAMGTSSHGIGTARLINESELQGSISGFAMGIAGIITSILAIPLTYMLYLG